MSFDANILSTKPIIKAAASMQNDGGGGNLGYMSQGRKKQEKEKRYLDESIFMKHNEEDIFSLSKEPEMVEGNVSITKLFEKAVKTVKKLIS